MQSETKKLKDSDPHIYFMLSTKGAGRVAYGISLKHGEADHPEHLKNGNPK